MRTATQAKADRKQLHQEIARDLRGKARAKLGELKSALRAAREERRRSHAHARVQCKLARAITRQRAKERRIRAVEELRAARLAERAAAHATCEVLKDDARRSLEGEARARAIFIAEQAYQRDLRRIEAANRKKLHEHARKSSAAERRSESDDAVRANLVPEMLSLWERVKGQIRGSARMSRTEAFLQYAHENPGELLGALDDQAEEQIRELERQASEAHRAAKRPPSMRTRMRRKYTAAELAGVPF